MTCVEEVYQEPAPRCKGEIGAPCHSTSLTYRTLVRVGVPAFPLYSLASAKLTGGRPRTPGG